MKLFTVSSGLLVAAFYSVFVLSFVGCEKTVDDAVLGNSVYLNPSDENLVAALFRQVITPEHEGNKAAYRDAFEKVLRLIRTSFDQDLDVTGNQDMISSKGKNDGTTSSSSGSRKLNRRSVEAPLTKGDDEETRSTRVPDSGFPKQPSNPNGKRIPDPRDVSPHPPPMSSSVDRVESQHTATYPREPAVYPPAANVDPNSYKPTPLEIKLEKFLDEYEPHHDDNSLKFVSMSRLSSIIKIPRNLFKFTKTPENRRDRKNYMLRKLVFNLSKFNRWGLYTHDVVDTRTPIIQEVLRRLPKDVLDARNFRIIRALQLDFLKTYLPREEWITYEQDLQYRYLQAYIHEIIAERIEIYEFGCVNYSEDEWPTGVLK
ncbi:Cytochrome b-c1 complex subunit 7 [Dufourea novaeangliae]|uniref:Cytochrome b-c1 complex subunit 7 n=1 Tax=Dufourea novaeangliae TaxID=178035 RepID=A0A154PDE8_DUFNO|nr:Cytochrome b-c1 complex subunit 7 [Dufourea novaeangliae]